MDNLKDWLALTCALPFKSYQIKCLYDHCRSIDAIIHAGDKTLLAFGFNKNAIQLLRHPPNQLIDPIYQWLDKPNHHIMTLDDPNYPPLLSEINDPPTLLYIVGNPKALLRPQIAIVGSRNPTPMGVEMAQEFAYALSKVDITVISGLAIGIDGASHRGALKAQGQTIAVLGNGLNTIYPFRHRNLSDEIAINGAVISEFPLQTGPLKQNFPLRNRIISGLSLGTLIVEATVRSGSLITARLACEQGREVFAIPGNIHNPLARGCHYLVQSGAKLVESVEDILTEIQQFALIYKDLVDDRIKPAQDKRICRGLSATEKQLLSCIGYEITAVNQVMMRSGLDAKTVTSQLLNLELNGHITSAVGGYSRVKI